MDGRLATGLRDASKVIFNSRYSSITVTTSRSRAIRHRLLQTMNRTNAITTDTVIIRAAGGPEISWRTQRMVSLGADAELAATIAHSDVDVHDIARLLKAGCPLELAWAITQPADESPADAPAADGNVKQALA
jgi:hypothetical protein